MTCLVLSERVRIISNKKQGVSSEELLECGSSQRTCVLLARHGIDN